MRVAQWLVALAGGLLAGSVCAADTIKIGVIDPLSGPFANIGQSSLKHYQAAVDQVNRHGGVLGVKFEIVAFDNKSSPQEALINLQAAIDQGIRFVTQASGSNIAHALIDAINKHNDRNPSRSIVYLNHGAVDPALTNEKCSFWHFRFDANGTMKLEVLTDAIARDQSVRGVYLLNQDYAWGHSVSRDAREMLARKRPDLQIVGEDLHPLGKVKDFAPYVSKVIESRADAVITGNWGNDLAVHMLAGAVEAARTTDPAKVASALEGLSYLSPTGPALMRKEDHQLIQPLYLATFTKAGVPGVKYDAEGTGFGWKTEARIEPEQTVPPTTCKMQRPGRQ